MMPRRAEGQKLTSDDCGAVRTVLMCTIPATALRFYMPLGRELRNNGYDVTFCFADGAEAEAVRREGFQVQTLSMRRKPFSLGNAIAVFQLAVFLRKNEVKVIETSTPVASLVGRIAAVVARVPVRINTVRGMFPRDTHRWQSALYDTVETVLHHASSFTIAINEKDELELLDKGFARQDRIVNIGCGGVGVDTEEFDPQRYDYPTKKKQREMLGIGKDDFVVTYVGRLTTEKGVLDLTCGRNPGPDNRPRERFAHGILPRRKSRSS